MLTRLRDEGYIAHPDKCEFFQREVSFLGHVVNERGLAVQQHKVEAVQRWPVPKSKKDVRAFLGLTGYYRKFIEGYGRLAIPLTELTKDDMVFAWGAKEQAAFDALKDRLTRAPVLAHSDPEKQFILHTDAGFAVSGVLSQQHVQHCAAAGVHEQEDEQRRGQVLVDQELLAFTCRAPDAHVTPSRSTQTTTRCGGSSRARRHPVTGALDGVDQCGASRCTRAGDNGAAVRCQGELTIRAASTG